ncbi:MAG: zf-HC2 domain-containing protein [Clostridia bacterium]|nr:zf-HC2 domain-containing protein [Clostridia bacterium]
MNCEKMMELMSEKLDGCISPEDEKILTDHLDKCESCRALYETLSNLDDAVRDCQMEPPAALHDGVMEAIRQEKNGKTSRKTWSLVAAIAAVAAAFVILAGAGLVQLPGMTDGQKANTVSMSDAVGLAFPKDLPGTEGLEAPDAETAAEENGCIVAVFWNCEGLAELENADAQVTENGARIYRVSLQTYETLLEKYQKIYPIGLYYPEGECSKENALIMLLQ